MTTLISSAERVNGTSSDFVIRFASTLHAGEYELLFASCPASVYNIDEDNNTFTYQVQGSVQTTVQLTPGFYSAPDLCVELQDKTGLDWEFNPLTARLVGTHHVDFRIFHDTSAHVTGFTEATGYAMSHSGDAIPNLSAPPMWLVELSPGSRGCVFAAGSWSTFFLPITEPALSMSTTTWGDTHQTFRVTQNLRECRIRLVDSLHRKPAVLHGAPWFFAIRPRC